MTPSISISLGAGKSEANREVVCVLRVVCIGLVHETLLYSTKFQSDLKLNSIFDR